MKHLCLDVWSGRFLKSSIEKIEKAASEVNRAILEEGSATLNDFYDVLGLDPLPMGDTFGWSEPLDVRFGAIIAKKGTPAITFWCRQDPTPVPD